MMRPKGRLVAKRNTRSMTEEDKAERAKSRVILKLGDSEYNRVKQQYAKLSAVNSRKSHSLLDGMILGLIQRNLSNREIRQVFKVGNNRINRLRSIMRNPELLIRKRFVPKHAVTPEDIARLKEHLATYDTEDGFPCAHRRARKFFVQQGLT